MTASSTTALVVDDEPILREIMCEWLELEGYRVLAAEHGGQALSPDGNPSGGDVLITDIRMPVMDGLSLLKRVQASGGNAPAAILVSGFTELTAREAYGLGVEAILSKPFTDDLLLYAVRRVFTPREELWRLPAPAGQGSGIGSDVPHGRFRPRVGGAWPLAAAAFASRSNAPVREGPIRFALNFPEDGLRLEGRGEVRWIQPGEEQIGIEISGLEGRLPDPRGAP